MHSQDVYRIANEARQLLSNSNGNNGRSMRRFLTRETTQGFVHQVFSQNPDASPAQLRHAELGAIDIHTLNLTCFPEGLLKNSLGTVVDSAFGLVQNSYEMNLDLQKASVKQMRLAVQCISDLSDWLEHFTNCDDGWFEPVTDEELAASLP